MKNPSSDNILNIIKENIDLSGSLLKDELLINNDKETLNNLSCPICVSVVWNPVHCSQCTHLICKKCIDNWLTKNKSCPQCRAEFQPMKLVVFVKDQLSKIKSKCWFVNNGCTKEIGYFDLEKHILGCDYYPYRCNQCKYVAPKINTIEHLNSCSYNTKACQYCKNNFPIRLLQSHEEMCDYKTKKCPRCQVEIREHLFKKHSETLDECVFNLTNIYKNQLIHKDKENAELKIENSNLNAKLNSSVSSEKLDELKNQNIQSLNRITILDQNIGKINLIFLRKL